MECNFDDCSHDKMRQRGYYRVLRNDWLLLAQRHKLSCHKKSKRLPNRYYLATENALSCWDSSLRRVLRIPPNDFFQRGVVGLLIYIM